LCRLDSLPHGALKQCCGKFEFNWSRQLMSVASWKLR
jgi:hypothetical protein